jgi:hypothetical protein
MYSASQRILVARELARSGCKIPAALNALRKNHGTTSYCFSLLLTGCSCHSCSLCACQAWEHSTNNPQVFAPVPQAFGTNPQAFGTDPQAFGTDSQAFFARFRRFRYILNGLHERRSKKLFFLPIVLISGLRQLFSSRPVRSGTGKPPHETANFARAQYRQPPPPALRYVREYSRQKASWGLAFAWGD